eukprot:TRINITY_DN13719_c0_g1_i9.p1 TRINITY_DN13719_c0_g1~~TRINITY_DN13719_c0_g1_i9.p1  ORF type:complete len:679 (-),score=140.25 TRINITY_DN13719_c0_g1_i9:129-2165(-)
MACRPGTMDPVFSHSKTRNETWVMLLEKAWAKLHGSYGAIEATSKAGVSHALHSLTGGDTGSILTSSIGSYAQLNEMLSSAQEGVQVLSLVVRDDGGAVEAIAADGIIKSHAYCVIGHTEVELEDRIEALVKLRNPWGSQEWAGDWSDTSTRWTPDMCDRLRHNPVLDDGEFYMSLRDMCTVYTRLLWVMVRPQVGAHPWKLQSARGSWSLQSDKQSLHAVGGCPNVLSWWTNPQYTLTVQRPCEIFISLEQPASHLAGQSQFAGYLTMGFSVFYLGQDANQMMHVLSPSVQTEVVSSQYSATQTVSAQVNMEPGVYKIVPSTLRPGGLGDFWLVVHSLEVDKKGRLLNGQPTDCPAKLETNPMHITESQRRVMDASFHAMSNRLHMAQTIAHPDTVVDLMRVGECDRMPERSNKYWGLTLTVYGRRTSKNTQRIQEWLTLKDLPYLLVDFSLQGNGQLPPHIRDGIRVQVGAEGFQLPVVSGFGMILVAGLKQPPISEQQIDLLLHRYPWEHHELGARLVNHQRNEIGRIRSTAPVLKMQSERRVALLRKQLPHATVEADAVALNHQLDGALADLVYAEMMMKQVADESEAEERLLTLNQIRSERNEGMTVSATELEPGAGGMVDDTVDVSTMALAIMDHQADMISQYGLCRCEAVHRAVNNPVSYTHLTLPTKRIV